MNRTMPLAAALLLALAACGEKPQRVMKEPDAAAVSPTYPGDLRDRTLRQGESGRIAY